MITTTPVNDRYEEDRAISLLARDQYVREMAWREALEPLTREEEVQLLGWVQCGKMERAKASPDQRVLDLAVCARTRLVEALQPVILDVAKKVLARRRAGCLELLDLVQEGNIELLSLLDGERFEHLDFTTVRSFGGLVATAVRWSMLKVVGDGSTVIHVPHEAREAVIELRRAEACLTDRLGRMPSYAELAEELRVSTVRVAEVVEYEYRWTVRSLQGLQQSPDSPGLACEEFVSFVNPYQQAVEESPCAQGRREAVNQALGGLSPREREVVRLRYGFDGGLPLRKAFVFDGGVHLCSTYVIADELGVSRSTASTLLGRGTGRLRRSLAFLCEEKEQVSA